MVTTVKGKMTKSGGDKSTRCGHAGIMTATRLREIMQSRGMRQADLARATGQQPGTISKLVKGNRSLDEHWAHMFAPVLHVPVHAFYEPVGKPIPPHRPAPPPHSPEAARMAAIRRVWWPNPAIAASVMGVPLAKLEAQESGLEPADPQYVVTLLRATRCPVRWITDGDITGLDPEALILLALDSPELVPVVSGGLGSHPKGPGDADSNPKRSAARRGPGEENGVS